MKTAQIKAPKQKAPTKHNWNKFLKYNRAAYKCQDEPIVVQLSSSVTEAISLKQFWPWQWENAGLNYGVKHGFLVLGDSITPNPYSPKTKYTPVFFTDKGMEVVNELKKTTCIFTGKRVK